MGKLSHISTIFKQIQRAIEKYDFEESEDFIPMDIDVSGNGIMEKTYIVTIDMAKELCMVSNTQKGK